MQKESDKKRHRCKLITQSVMAFLDCLNVLNQKKKKKKKLSEYMVKAKARNEAEVASSVETSDRSLNVSSKLTRKLPVSSGKRGGVNNHDM
ncbi:BnaC09g46720D [Brassica napus]|uniref:BnaC09g46720D protein n=1 Tax=Brassica napus TaxID=3708 RepID=A0A078G585_BRANA|nr:BnaC09g46720D [Brassica napus]